MCLGNETTIQGTLAAFKACLRCIRLAISERKESLRPTMFAPIYRWLEWRSTGCSPNEETGGPHPLGRVLRRPAPAEWRALRWGKSGHTKRSLIFLSHRVIISNRSIRRLDYLLSVLIVPFIVVVMFPPLVGSPPVPFILPLNDNIRGYRAAFFGPLVFNWISSSLFFFLSLLYLSLYILALLLVRCLLFSGFQRGEWLSFL